LHRFLENLIEKVHNNVPSATKGENGISLSPGTMLLPHCTWEKFGDILANNGARIYGLFDELVSFFSTMNMYSSSKSTVQDNREYQDFLKMFTGKAKNRETSKFYVVYIIHLILLFSYKVWSTKLTLILFQIKLVHSPYAQTSLAN
jgi:hypothetical protein